MGKDGRITPQTKDGSGRNHIKNTEKPANKDSSMPDYKEYVFSYRELIRTVLEYIALCASFAFLFYRSLAVFGVLCCFYPIYHKKKRKQFIERRQQILCREFKDAIQCVAAALAAGYSIENAFREAYVEMKLQYGSKGLMTEELKYISSSISLNIPLEQLLQEFAVRSGLEDVQSFCEVFIFAKRSGGDFIGIIHMTTARIAEKNELMDEIQTEIAGKRMEQKIMNVMPLFILAYVDLSFGDYLYMMYHSMIGIAVMTACLLAYLGAYFLSEKIMDIHV